MRLALNPKLADPTLHWRQEKPLATQHFTTVLLMLLSLIVLTISLAEMAETNLRSVDSVFFLVMIVIALLLTVRLPKGIYIGGFAMVEIAAAFTVGYQDTMALTLLAAAICLPIRLVLAVFNRLSLQNLVKVTVELLAHATVVPLVLVLVAQIFPNAIHGTHEFQHLAETAPVLIMSALMLFSMVFLLFCILWLSLSNAQVRTYFQEYWLLVVGNGVLYMTFGPLLAAVYVAMQPYTLMVGMIFVLVLLIVTTFYRLYVQRISQVNLLTIIEQLDAGLSKAQTVEDVARVTHSSMNEVTDASNFQLALYDETERLLSFPLVYKNGGLLNLRERPFSNGFAEQVILTDAPLVLNKDAIRQAKERGFMPDRAADMGLDRWDSLLAVPLTSEDTIIGVLTLRNHQNGFRYYRTHINAVQMLARRVANAIARTRLLETTQRQASELQSVTEVSSLVGASLNLQSVIDSVCRTVIDLLHAQKAAVYLVTETNNEVELAGSVGLTERFRERSALIPLDAPRVREIRTGQPVIIENMELALDFGFERLDRYIRALIAVPMSSEGRTIGSLVAYYTHPHRFTDHAIRLAETMASQIGVAVKNARLFEAERIRQRELEALYTASTRLATSLSLRSVLDATVSSIIEALETDVCCAFLLDEQEHRLEPAVYLQRNQDGQVAYQDELGASFALDTMPIMRNALAKARLRYIRRNADLTEQEQTLLENHGIRSAMVIPLVVHQFQIGVLFAGSRSQNQQYDEQRLKQMQLLLNQAAVALQNARLFETIDVALTSRMNELEALGRIAQRMTSQLDIEEVLDQVVDAAASATQATICEIILVDDNDNILQVVTRLQGENPETQPRWSGQYGIARSALDLGEPIIISDVQQVVEDILPRDNTRSIIATPILLDRKKLGVINIESKDVDAFDQTQVRFLTHLAEHAAIAIQNARLFKTVQQRADEFNALRDLGVQLLSANTLKETLQLIVKAAQQQVNAGNVHIFLQDQRTGEIKTGVSLLDTGEVDMNTYFPAAQRLTDHIREHEKPILAPSVRQNQLFEDVLPLLEQQNIGGAVCLPLRRGDALIGTFIATFDTEEAGLTEDTVRFLDLLASQAAVAIATEQLAEATRAGRDQLQAILHSINDGIVMLDRSGRVIMANSRAEYLLNVHLNNFIGETFAEIFEQIAARNQQETGFLALNEIRDIEQTARENPNLITRRTYELHEPSFRALREISSPVTNEAGQALGRLFVIRDVTQEVMLDQYQKEMSGMIVHDLRAPLSGVISSIYFALEEADAAPEALSIETIKTALNIALTSSDSLLQLIEAILDINKLEAGEMQLDQELQDIRVVINKVVEGLQPRLDQALLQIVLEVPDVLPLIDIDQQTMERVFHNLLDNAIRHTPEGGSIHIIVKREETHLQIVVEDTGSGIEAAMREKIFERFRQNDRSRRYRGGKGSGLGLTFCRLAIDAHGGRIWVDEGRTGGAAFHFTLPLSPTEPPPTE